MLSLSEGFRIQEGLLARRENQSRETIWDFFSGYSEGKRLERAGKKLAVGQGKRKQEEVW